MLIRAMLSSIIIEMHWYKYWCTQREYSSFNWALVAAGCNHSKEMLRRWTADFRDWHFCSVRQWEVTEEWSTVAGDWITVPAQGQPEDLGFNNLIPFPESKQSENWPGSESSHIGHHGRYRDGCGVMVGFLHTGPVHLWLPHLADRCGRTTEGSGTQLSRNEGLNHLQTACRWPQQRISWFKLADAPSRE